MEPSRRNPWQPVAIRKGAKPRKQAKTVAVGCDGLREEAHGKEGVDGSSPSEGSAKPPQIGIFLRIDLQERQRAQDVELLMELSGPEPAR